MELKVKKMHEDAELPVYATDGSACFDLKVLKADLPYQRMFLQNGESMVLRTGLAFEIPKDHVMLVFSRSGQGFKYDTRLSNCVGVIDSDYRGEVMVKLTKDSGSTPELTIKEGDAIAQAMIVPVQTVEFVLVDDLSDTDRGENGFGSTDRH